jgi:hypothetical protein
MNPEFRAWQADALVVNCFSDGLLARQIRNGGSDRTQTRSRVRDRQLSHEPGRR